MTMNTMTRNVATAIIGGDSGEDKPENLLTTDGGGGRRSGEFL